MENGEFLLWGETPAYLALLSPRALWAQGPSWLSQKGNVALCALFESLSWFPLVMKCSLYILEEFHLFQSWTLSLFFPSTKKQNQTAIDKYECGVLPWCTLSRWFWGRLKEHVGLCAGNVIEYSEFNRTILWALWRQECWETNVYYGCWFMRFQKEDPQRLYHRCLLLVLIKNL